MENKVTILDMFPDYQPPEELPSALAQAAIVAADIDPEERVVSVAVHADAFLPQREMDRIAGDIAGVYGLRRLELTATFPADQLTKMDPDSLMQLFVSRNSMTRGALAGAAWEWEGTALHIRLKANGKKELEELNVRL